MSLLAQLASFPLVILPAFIGMALLLAFAPVYRRLPLFRIPSVSWITWLAASLAAAGTVYLLDRHAGYDVGIEVDMLVSRGNAVALYLNGSKAGQRLPLVVGVSHVYRFEHLPRDINRLQLDPADVADARIVIYKILVKTRARVLQQWGPGELKNWTRRDLLASPNDSEGGLAMLATSGSPSMACPLSLRLPGGVWQSLSEFIGASDGPFQLAIAVFLLVLLGRMATSSGRLQAVLIAVTAVMAVLVVVLVQALELWPPPVTAAVGYAAYHGYPKVQDYLSAVTLMLACVCLGCAFAGMAHPAGAEQETVTASRRRNIRIVTAAVFAMLFLHFLPDLREALENLKQTVYEPHGGLDEPNALAWAYMIHGGLRPFRDFWYPYSGFYVQLLPFPVGAMASALHGTIVLWVLFLALLKATGRRLVHALAMFGLIVIPVLLGMLPRWDRYLLAIDVAILYVAACDGERLEWKTRVLFAAFVGYAFFFEPTQVLYAGAGIGLHIVVSAACRRPAESIQVLRERFLRVGIPMLAGITTASLVYAVNGMLAGLWDFEKSIGDMGNYGALPADISTWVLPVLQPDTVFLLMFMLASYAAYRRVRMKEKPDGMGDILVVLSGTAFAAVQKQLVRPHVMAQVQVYPYVALLIFGLIAWRERTPVSRIVIAAFLGCMLGIALHGGVARTIILQDLAAGPAKAAGFMEALLRGGNEFKRVNATLYSRSRFSGFDEQMAVTDSLLQTCGLRTEDRIYVLGDDSIFYILLSKRPPYSINSYNDSPVYEQQKVLEGFKREPPRFVIWRTDALEYDTVPHAVRLPLLYTYVVEHYRFVRAIGPYHILAVRPPEEPPDSRYWRSVLGSRIDLGHVPGISRLSSYSACEAGRVQCDALLVVRYPQSIPVPRGKLAVNTDSPDGAFEIQFDLIPGKREYVVNLNRLWFWGLVSKPVASRTVEGAAVAVDYRSERTPVLY